VGVPQVLDAIMQLFPLDEYAKAESVQVMQVVPGDTNAAARPPIWEQFESITRKHEGDWVQLQEVERFRFYEEAKNCFTVIATSETAIYANIILKKGIIKPSKYVRQNLAAIAFRWL
jgi:L-fucose mutarotase